MIERAEPAPDPAQRALQDALASIPDGARRSAVPVVPSPAEVSEPAVAVSKGEDRKAFSGEEDPLIKHITFLGSFMTRRLDEVDRRLDELAASLELLRTSLQAADSQRPVPDPSSLADSLKLLRTSLREADAPEANPRAPAARSGASATAAAGRRAKGTRAAARTDPDARR